LSSTHKMVFFGRMGFKILLSKERESRAHRCASAGLGENGVSRVKGWPQPPTIARCGPDSYGDSGSLYSSSARPSASDLNSIVRLKADSCVTSTATLAQSTKMKAMCKRRRSSEVMLAFYLRFHRESRLCCQCCLFAYSALLKACESFKEKALFCYRISAAKKEKIAPRCLAHFFFLNFPHLLRDGMADSGTLAKS
jgi:hypothetical protein